MSEIGHNIDATTKARILAFIERVERIENEVRALNDDKSDIYKEAKGSGFHVKALKQIVAMRRMDRDKRREEEEILDLYLTTIGMVD